MTTSVLLALLLAAALGCEGRPLHGSLEGRVMVGYQGWHYTDEQPNPWNHWCNLLPGPPNENGTNLHVDLWPDMSEYPDLHATGLKYKDGRAVGVYSSLDASTVGVHLRWMREYNIDGAFVQRFLTTDMVFYWRRTKTLYDVMRAAEQNGRSFAVMWDAAVGSEADMEAIKADWQVIRNVTQSPAYQWHNGRPVVCWWGVGFPERGSDAGLQLRMVRWLKEQGLTVMGGTPYGWQSGTGDSRSGWAEVYAALDIVSPWAVGRYNSEQGFDDRVAHIVADDVAAVAASGQGYAPVIFPGFSWYNPHQGSTPLDEIPRNCGSFLQHQIDRLAPVRKLFWYVAMFDEVDEGTAIYKVETRLEKQPNLPGYYIINSGGKSYHYSARLVNSSAHQCGTVPNDHYLRIVGGIPRPNSHSSSHSHPNPASSNPGPASSAAAASSDHHQASSHPGGTSSGSRAHARSSDELNVSPGRAVGAALAVACLAMGFGLI
eukprot:m51a1_g14238 hypothetical protein (487) ;mRNA; r:229911-231371